MITKTGIYIMERTIRTKLTLKKLARYFFHLCFSSIFLFLLVSSLSSLGTLEEDDDGDDDDGKKDA